MDVETDVKVAHKLQICLVQGFVLNTQLFELLDARKILLVREEAHGKLRHLSDVVQGQPQFPNRSEESPVGWTVELD